MNTCKNLILFNIIFSFIISFFSCKKEEDKIMKVRNDSISDITSTTAKANATIIDIGQGINQYGHCWSTNAELIITDNENLTENGQTDNTGPYSSILTGLAPGTKYFVRAYVKNNGIVVYGTDILPFTTLSMDKPVVITGIVTNITTSDATVTGNLISLGEGASSVTQYGHCWSSETTTPVIGDDSRSSLGSRDTTGNYESQLVGLSSSTVYYVRAYAINDAGTDYGDTLRFTTYGLINAEFYANPKSGYLPLSVQFTDRSTGDINSWSWDFGDEGTSNSRNPLHTYNDQGIYSVTLTVSDDISSDSETKINYIIVNASGVAPVVGFTADRTSITEGEAVNFMDQSINVPTSWSWNFGDGGTSTDKNPSYQYNTEGVYTVTLSATNSCGSDYETKNNYIEVKKIMGWQRSLGGSYHDRAYSIRQTAEGGYIIAGRSNSNDGNVSGNHGDYDCWVVKLNSTGGLQWQKSLGGSSYDRAYCIEQTSDDGYIISGRSDSDDGDVSENHGAFDCWIVRLNSSGTMLWEKSLGGSADDYAYFIQQTDDEGYIVTGHSNSNNGDVTGNHGEYDFWIVKLTSTGDITWQKSLGGSGNDGASCIRQTADGGYIIAGNSDSNDGDVSGNHGLLDYWIVKLNSTGGIEWQKSLGGSEEDYVYSVQQTTDGGYIIAGTSESNDGDISNNKGNADCWIVKLTSTGGIVWQKSLGGSANDAAHSIHQTTDGDYIIAGESSSNDGDATENQGGSDLWIVKLNSSGEFEWQESLGGSLTDNAYSIQQTTDGSYVVAGESNSNDGDVSGNHGDYDYWIVKINKN